MVEACLLDGIRSPERSTAITEGKVQTSIDLLGDMQDRVVSRDEGAAQKVACILEPSEVLPAVYEIALRGIKVPWCSDSTCHVAYGLQALHSCKTDWL